MGLDFRWFKDYKILNSGETYQAFGHCYYDEYSIEYIDCSFVSHSYYNVALVKELFEKVIGIQFPRLPNEEWIDSKDYRLKFIKPIDMSKYCEKILNNTEVDNINMRSRFEWFKDLSDKGYYIAYDWE